MRDSKYGETFAQKPFALVMMHAICAASHALSSWPPGRNFCGIFSSGYAAAVFKKGSLL
jgi:hypothetical protein